jgi:hypothetical protein
MKYGLLALFLAVPSLSAAWGRQGHWTIACVAEARLSPAARRMVQEFRSAPGWERLKPGDTRYYRKADEEWAEFCRGSRGDLYLASEWADAWREHHPDTAPWHYVDIPEDGTATEAEITQACGDGCILSKLDEERAVLRDKGADRTRRLEALLWVVHLVGDIHQPLHCADHGDKGGNAIGVFVAGRVSNLHAAWDTGFFYVEHARPQELAADLLEHECGEVELDAKAEPKDWARESFGVAKTFAYPQVQRNGGEFDPSEVGQAWPVVRRQLARAGIRLAAVLNKAAE